MLCTAASPNIVLRVDLSDFGDENIQFVLKSILGAPGTNLLLEHTDATSLLILLIEQLDGQKGDMIGRAAMLDDAIMMSTTAIGGFPA